MIGTLTGTVNIIDEHGIIVETGGVGFRVRVLGEYLKDIKRGTTVSLWTHLAVREDSLELFGFRNKEELDLFSMLLGVSGIGPKSALSILTIAPPKTLKSAIAARDSSYLTKVSGIGRKNAEKIILELRDKLGVEGTSHELPEDTDTILALRSMGYGTQEAREAIKKIPDSVKETGGRIKEALKHLGTQ